MGFVISRFLYLSNGSTLEKFQGFLFYFTGIVWLSGCECGVGRCAEATRATISFMQPFLALTPAALPVCRIP